VISNTLVIVLRPDQQDNEGTGVAVQVARKSRIALPTLAFGFAGGMAIVGIILAWRAPRPRWIFVLALAVTLGALRCNLAQPHSDRTTLATCNDQQKCARCFSRGRHIPYHRDQRLDLNNHNIVRCFLPEI
jgi:hypothetical protein